MFNKWNPYINIYNLFKENKNSIIQIIYLEGHIGLVRKASNPISNSGSRSFTKDTKANSE